MTEPVERIVYVERPRRKVNGTAIFALIMSWMWLIGIGSLLGLIFGIISVRECQRRDEAGEVVGHLAWISGLVGLLLTVAWVVSTT